MPNDVVSHLPGQTDEKTVVSNRPPLPVPGQGDSMRRFELGQFHPGDCLDHFELIEFVGGGGMGRVFKAMDLRLNRIVALKVIPRELASDSETLQRFLNEARSAALLDHENVVRVFHIGEANGMHFLVFEFVEGQTIRDIVQQRGRLPLTEAIHYAIQVADAVAHLAEQGVVHRDIKPSNILVDPHGRVKVIDLGLARIYHTAANEDLTATGVTLGTFDYISPEQARDPRSVDARSDIYSLGCTLFYMLSGRPPFPEGTVLQKLLRHQGDTPPDIREFRPELPEEISLLMRKMMAKDPNRRFRSATLLLEQLLVVAEHIGLRTNRHRTWPAAPLAEYSFLQRHLPWIIPTCLLFGIGAALSVFWAPPSREPVPVTYPSDTAPGVEAVRPVGGTREPEAGPLPGESESIGRPADTETPLAPGPERSRPGIPLPAGIPGSPSGMGTREGEKVPADGTTATGPATGSLAESESAMASVVVDPAARPSAGVYASVAEALRRAPNATAVELRFTGVSKETGWNLSGRNVRVFAAADARPILRFAPDVAALQASESVVRAGNGRLVLADTAMELEIPRADTVEQWTFIQLADKAELAAAGCSFTIRNAADRGIPYHEDVAFFRTAQSNGTSGIGGGTGGSGAAAGVSVELTDTVVRGEASLLWADVPVSVSLRWNNGLLAVNRPAIFTRGIRSSGGGTEINVYWRHVTAILDLGFWRMTATENRSGRIRLGVTTTDCILATSTANALVEQTNGNDLEQLHRMLNWSGERNFYQGFQTFWSIRHAGSVGPVETWDFEQWKTYWGPEQENLPNLERVVWKKPLPANRPFNEHTPRDYALNDDPGVNPAAAAATDGQDVGAVLEKLPEPPPGLTTPKTVQ